MLSTPDRVANGAAKGAPRLSAGRILVVRLGALGDVVRTRFAFQGLRALYPDARIDWLVEDRAAVGLSGIVGLDGTVVVPRSTLGWTRPQRLWAVPLSVVRELRGRGYDMAIDFHGILKSAALCRAAGIPQRVGYAAPLGREGSARLYTHHVHLPDVHVSRFERNAALVHWLGGAVPDQAPPLQLAPDAGRGLDALPAAFVAMHPGTSPGTEYKRWPLERFGAVAAGLREATGLPTVVTWGPVRGERERAQAVVDCSSRAAALAPETASVEALIELLRRSSLFVGGDSGPLHLAALAARPVVVIFGPTDPVENAPFAGVGLRVVRRDVGCNPCREGCPARACLDAVRADEVISAGAALIAAGPGGR